MEGETAKVGLKINEQKTTYMIAARPGQVGGWGEQRFRIFIDQCYV
jgi:hypothetical protein